MATTVGDVDGHRTIDVSVMRDARVQDLDIGHVRRKRGQDLLLARRTGGPGDLAAGGVEHQRGRRPQDAEPADQVEVVLGVDLDVLDARDDRGDLAPGSAGSRGTARRTPTGELQQGGLSPELGLAGSASVDRVPGVAARLADPRESHGARSGAAEPAVGERPVAGRSRGRAAIATTAIQAPVLTRATTRVRGVIPPTHSVSRRRTAAGTRPSSPARPRPRSGPRCRPAGRRPASSRPSARRASRVPGCSADGAVDDLGERDRAVDLEVVAGDRRPLTRAAAQ